MDQVSDSCGSYDLTISIKKTEVVYQPTPGKPYNEPNETKSVPGLPKLVQYLADYVEVFGIEVKSDFTQS